MNYPTNIRSTIAKLNTTRFDAACSEMYDNYIIPYIDALFHSQAVSKHESGLKLLLSYRDEWQGHLQPADSIQLSPTLQCALAILLGDLEQFKQLSISLDLTQPLGEGLAAHLNLIHLAAIAGHVAIWDEIIPRVSNTDLLSKVKDGYYSDLSAIYWLSYFGHQACLKKLFSQSENSKEDIIAIMLHEKNHNGQSAIKQLIKHGYINIIHEIAQLLHHSCSMKEMHEILMITVKYKQMEIIKELFLNNDVYQPYLLEEAVNLGDETILHRLFESGIPVPREDQIKDLTKRSPGQIPEAIYTVSRQFYSILEKLAEGEIEDILEQLKIHPVYIHFLDLEKNGILHHIANFAENNNLKPFTPLIKMCIEHKIPLEKRNNEGYRAIDIAKQNNNFKLIDKLTPEMDAAVNALFSNQDEVKIALDFISSNTILNTNKPMQLANKKVADEELREELQIKLSSLVDLTQEQSHLFYQETLSHLKKFSTDLNRKQKIKNVYNWPAETLSEESHGKLQLFTLKISQLVKTELDRLSSPMRSPSKSPVKRFKLEI